MKLTVEEWIVYFDSKLGQAVEKSGKQLNESTIVNLMTFTGWSRERVLNFAQKVQEQDLPEEESRPGFVYLLHAIGTNRFKIGVTKSISTRLSQISKQSPFPTQIVHSFESKDCFAAEKELHKRFSNKRVYGEWFEFDDSDVDCICKICG